MPNIAYVGGPGELAYWLQLKSNFDNFNVQYPVLALRDSFLLINKNTSKSLNKLGISAEEMLDDLITLKKKM